MTFANILEGATLDTIESGVMTKDLAALWDGDAMAVTSEEFLDAIAERVREEFEGEYDENLPEFETYTLVGDDGREEDYTLVYRATRGEEEYAVLLSDEEEGKVLIARCVYDGDECNFDAVDDETADDVFAEFEAECPEFFDGEDGEDA